MEENTNTLLKAREALSFIFPKAFEFLEIANLRGAPSSELYEHLAKNKGE